MSQILNLGSSFYLFEKRETFTSFFKHLFLNFIKQKPRPVSLNKQIIKRNTAGQQMQEGKHQCIIHISTRQSRHFPNIKKNLRPSIFIEGA